MNDGSVRFYMKGNGTAAFIYGNIVTDNNWHHIAASRNGSTGEMKIFVDGVLNNSKNKNFLHRLFISNGSSDNRWPEWLLIL